MSNSFKLKPIVLAMVPLLVTGNVYAVEEENKADEVETIEVTGYRGSILKSIHDKRNSKTIVDSIFAEDIGKTTDQNIADALSRVTGVSIQQEDGEGTKISVRGAGANLNNISLNGVQLTSSDPNQGVDLSAFSADILSQISVYKTSSADHDEGSLGANVILRTAKPLNTDERTSFEYQGRYNQFADKADRKLSASLSRKFFDERFGFILTAADETQSVRKDSVTGNWLDPYQVTTLKAGGARDLDGNIIQEDMNVIMQKSLGFSLNQNQRDRSTVTAGFQFIPTDSTDIQLDLSYSKQNVVTDDHKINVNVPNFWGNSDSDNLTVGKWGNVQDPEGGDLLDPETGTPIPLPAVADPQEDWWTVNTDSHTVVKSLNRFGNGSFGRLQREDETINKIVTLNVTQDITDSLRVEFKAGYSATDYDILNASNVNTANWDTTPNSVLREIPLSELEPVGYDCTSGTCQMVVGTSPYTYVPGGINDNMRNKPTTGFNPLDPGAHHVGYVSADDNFTKDVNKSLFVDFDWDLDEFGITTIEFGGKVSQRTKDVYTKNGLFQGNAISAFDPITGKPIPGLSPSSIRASEIVDDASFPVTDWMNGLAGMSSDYDTSFVKNGWGLINAEKAFYQMFALDDVEINYDESGRRKMIQDNYSVYGKLNFELFDGRLTGDAGLRFVHTEVTSPIGSSKIEYFRTDRIFTPHELVANGLFNQELDPCTKFANTNQTIRIDGTYQLGDDQSFTDSNGTTYGAGETIPNEYPCYDPNIAESTYVDPVSGESVEGFAGPEIPVTNGRSWWGNIRHADQSTLGDANYQRLYESNGFGESDVWLPSLNLNYQFSQELIGRFATSKTMARPGFDKLRPAFSVNEDVWGQFSRINVPNPNLQPLESTNLDLSIEWYFNDSGQLSIAAFNKDMVNFAETVKDNFYYRDMRHSTDSEISIEDILIPIDSNLMAGQDTTTVNGTAAQCMPDRAVQDKLKGTLSLGCELAQTTIERNGKSAYTRGIEFAYRQSFDFLPGIWSGIGTNINYTYAKSESDAEILEASGNKLKAAPQAYTPKHTLNTALYWEKFGHQIKLTHRYNSIQMDAQGMLDGRAWVDARSVIDLSANYKVNDMVSISFNALNLTNSDVRTFFTSTTMNLGDQLMDAEGNYLNSDGAILPEGHAESERVSVVFDEGNPMEDSSVPTHRTINAYKTGRQFRLGVRVKF
ncbi:TonB-dependent receptor [Algibacillus agarilyticus]|uniref:TonB-dependent receptor n=1 Tax=Algibacillus agarilyticus TaxID=2234133 RepID=UPI000DD00147|nr:TonB-dependent receptor [Algibacillus agarilyticus]